MVARVNASDSDEILELLMVSERMAWDDAGQVDGQTIVDAVTLIGDIASDGLAEDEVKTYETLGGTVVQVMMPSIDRFSGGFVLGPITVPPLGDLQLDSASVQVISWARNVFDQQDISQTMLTFSVRKGKEHVALTNLFPPLLFTLDVSERVNHSVADTFHRTCVFWNSSSGNWSDRGVEVGRANLTQVGIVMLSNPVASTPSAMHRDAIRALARDRVTLVASEEIPFAGVNVVESCQFNTGGFATVTALSLIMSRMLSSRNSEQSCV